MAPPTNYRRVYLSMSPADGGKLALHLSLEPPTTTNGMTAILYSKGVLPDGWPLEFDLVTSTVVGPDGKSAYKLAQEAGYGGTLTQWLASLVGADGKSAYQIARDAGYGGTQTQWLASLAGKDGTTPAFSIGTVSTLPAGSAATATIGGTPAAPQLSLGLPRGSDATATPLASTPPAALAPAAAQGSGTSAARADHVHPLPTVTPSTPTRALGTTFQPNATKAVLVSYSAKTQVTNPLLAGSSTATVVLLSDANNPPTTERARVEAVSAVGLAVSIALTTSNTAALSYLVPAGHYVRLVSTVSGTGSTALTSQSETTLG